MFPRTSVLGVVNSVSGISRKKVDWTCGSYSSKKCYSYVVYSKCATRPDVWNGKEVEGLLEESEDTKPYMDDNKIQHFSLKKHYLRLDFTVILCEETTGAIYAHIRSLSTHFMDVWIVLSFSTKKNALSFVKKGLCYTMNDLHSLKVREITFCVMLVV